MGSALGPAAIKCNKSICHETRVGVSINGGTLSHHPFIDGFPMISPYKPSSYWGTPIYGTPQQNVSQPTNKLS